MWFFSPSLKVVRYSSMWLSGSCWISRLFPRSWLVRPDFIREHGGWLIFEDVIGNDDIAHMTNMCHNLLNLIWGLSCISCFCKWLGGARWCCMGLDYNIRNAHIPQNTRHVREKWLRNNIVIRNPKHEAFKGEVIKEAVLCKIDICFRKKKLN